MKHVVALLAVWLEHRDSISLACLSLACLSLPRPGLASCFKLLREQQASSLSCCVVVWSCSLFFVCCSFVARPYGLRGGGRESSICRRLVYTVVVVFLLVLNPEISLIFFFFSYLLRCTAVTKISDRFSSLSPMHVI